VTFADLVSLEPLRIIDETGSVVGDLPDLDDERLVELYELMVRSRDADRRATAAQRQGRIGTYPMLEGHEAAQVGSAAALEPDDFIYPGYRERAVEIARGMPLDVILSYWRGLPTKQWDVDRYRMMTIAVPIASQIPHAVGHAYAARQRGEQIVTVTYFGDGATSETDFHAGLNFAGVMNAPTVMICENNLYAISVPYAKQTASETIAQKAIGYGIRGVRVDGMDVLAMYAVTREAADRARSGGGPTLIEALCYRFGAHATADDARRYRDADEEDEWRLRDPLVRYRHFLEDRGLWDDDKEAATLAGAATDFAEAMESLESMPVPPRGDIVRHAYARIPRLLVDQIHALEIGAGEEPTVYGEDEVWQLHDDPAPSGPTATMTMVDAVNMALTDAMEREPTLIVMGEDVGLTGGVFRITEGLQAKFGEERVIDTPLNESGIVGTAIGMAISGSRVVAEIQFDGFVYPSFDQIVNHVGRIRFRSQGHVSLPLVIRWPNGAGIGAHEQHCDSPEAYFAHAPGQTVIVPSTPYDAKGLLAAALEADDPVLFLEPKVLYRAMKEQVPTDHYTISIGKARVRRRGDDVTVVTYGGMVPVALQAADLAASEGISVEVIDLRTVYPWDVETVIGSVERTGRLVLVQEPQRTGGIAAEIAAEVAERSGYALLSPIQRVTATDAPWPQFAIERHALVTSQHVLTALRRSTTG
jgi:2-oxoisovalerate dehydrogenase E1 component